MARLNEPSASVETLDGLKRRFIRQNREIARVNSTQSLRIRTLECEISSLLSENINLRERVIKLQYEADKRLDRSVLDNVGSIKGRLEAKLSELGGLVEELHKVQINVEDRRSLEKRRTSIASPKKSPDQKNWKTVLTLSEVTGRVDDRLPPIVEDKYYPRRTLDPGEIGQFPDIANLTDSPELGPPPIAHFEEGNPSKVDSKQEPITSEAPPNIIADAQPTLFANLETRKKRRETSNLAQPIQDATSCSQPLQPLGATDESMSKEQHIQSCAKRKLNARENENRSRPESGLSKDEFLFNRKYVDSSKKGLGSSGVTKKGVSGSQRGPQELVTQASHEKTKGSATVAPNKGRKALGPKNVNASPTKLSRLAMKDKLADLRVNAPSQNDEDSTNGKSPKRYRSAPKDVVTVVSTQPYMPSVKSPLETTNSTASDALSIINSETSIERPDLSDTFPPLDVNPDESDAEVQEKYRPTRRPRGSVSYAEPNLRHKMRRPTKDLVDAVGAEERIQHAIIIKDENDLESEIKLQKNALRTVVIKKEENSTDSAETWKTAYPTEDQFRRHQDRAEATNVKTTNNDASKPENAFVTVNDQEPVQPAPSDIGQNANESEKKLSGAGTAIAALTAGKQKPKRREEVNNINDEPDTHANILNLHQGSPVDATGKALDKAEDKSEGIEADRGIDTMSDSKKHNRRHSSMPVEEIHVGSDAEGRIKGAVARRKERKRETLLTTTTTTAGGEERRGTELKSARSVTRLQGREGGGDDMVPTRSERAASRRRSMML